MKTSVKIRGAIALICLLFIITACNLPGTATQPAPAPSTSKTETPEPPAPAKHRIGVRQVDGVGEFFDRQTGEKFTPRGANYIRLATLPMINGGRVRFHSTFNTGMYDPDASEAALREMQSLGYNTVRVFLDGNCQSTCIAQTSGGLNSDYIANLTDFLKRAKQHDIYVLLTTDGHPATQEYIDVLDTTWSKDFQGGNQDFLRMGGIRADSKFAHDLIQALRQAGAPFDAILAYELRNEQFFSSDATPFTLDQGTVKTANGKTYDMSQQSDKDQMMEDGLIYWFDQVRASILKDDPTMLVTVGFFWPQDPNPTRAGDPRAVKTKRFLRESSADFFDLHPYPGVELNLQQYVENYKMDGIQNKPILMGEFGAATDSYSNAAAAAQALDDWQVESCKYGFDGWLHWTWDTDEDSNFYHGESGNGEINQALAPANRPDPCQEGKFDFFVHNLALGKDVSVSAALNNEPPQNAVDGKISDRWGAGAPPTQWIEIDLGAQQDVGTLRLAVSQSPAGRTVHKVYAGASRDSLSLVHTFDGNTADFDTLEFKPDKPLQEIRFIRVVTTASPSWVAWREIEVLAP